MTVEPGRHVAGDGLIVYHWPPEGRFAHLWQRIQAALPSDDDKCEAVWHVPTGWLEP